MTPTQPAGDELRGEINALLYEWTESDDIVKELGDLLEPFVRAWHQKQVRKLYSQDPIETQRLMSNYLQGNTPLTAIREASAAPPKTKERK